MEPQKSNGRLPALGVVPSLESSGELAPTASAASEVARVHGAIVAARQFPRDEERFLERLLAICRKPSFADEALYSFPRGREEINGPSVVFAREALRLWGNAFQSLEILRDDPKGRKIRGRVFDLETNMEVAYEDDFAKLVQRKIGGVTQWVPADERDLRELTFRRGAILVRNAILGVIPARYTDQAIAVVEETLRAPQEDRGRTLQAAVDAFAKRGVGRDALERYLGHAIDKTTAEEIAHLKMVHRAIVDGTSTWADYAAARAAAGASSAAGGTSGTNDSPEDAGGGLKLQTPFRAKAPSAPTPTPTVPATTGDLPLEDDDSPIPH